MAESIKREPRKPYVKPTLTVHGTVRELTQKQGSAGKIDHGNRFTPRTHV